MPPAAQLPAPQPLASGALQVRAYCEPNVDAHLPLSPLRPRQLRARGAVPCIFYKQVHSTLQTRVAWLAYHQFLIYSLLSPRWLSLAIASFPLAMGAPSFARVSSAFQRGHNLCYLVTHLGPPRSCPLATGFDASCPARRTRQLSCTHNCADCKCFIRLRNARSRALRETCFIEFS